MPKSLIEYWPFLASIVFAFLLVAIVGAFICSQKFRHDVIAASGKAKVFGVLSIEGVVVVILCGVFAGGLILSMPSGMDSTNEIKLQNRIEQLEGDLEQANNDLDKSYSMSEIPTAIRNLKPEGSLSEKVRRIAQERDGPWSPYRISEEVVISVPGGMKAGSVRSCPEYYNERVELLGKYDLGDTDEVPDRITVTVDGKIFNAADCSDRIEYDFQLNCNDANELFSDEVVQCDSNNDPLWNVEQHKLPAYAVIVTNTQ